MKSPFHKRQLVCLAWFTLANPCWLFQITTFSFVCLETSAKMAGFMMVQYFPRLSCMPFFWRWVHHLLFCSDRRLPQSPGPFTDDIQQPQNDNTLGCSPSGLMGLSELSFLKKLNQSPSTPGSFLILNPSYKQSDVTKKPKGQDTFLNIVIELGSSESNCSDPVDDVFVIFRTT